jgi:copper(I)-binding protein
MMKMFYLKLTTAILILFSSPLMAHTGHEHNHDVAQLALTNAQVRVFLPASTSSVGYFSVINHSDVAATLVKASVDGLGRVEIHEHRHENGMMKMQKVDSLTIAPFQQIDFQPGGYHLMVFEPQEPLKVGQERKLTLYFKDGNRIFTNAQVVSLEEQVKQSAPAKPHSHH